MYLLEFQKTFINYCLSIAVTFLRVTLNLLQVLCVAGAAGHDGRRKK